MSTTRTRADRVNVGIERELQQRFKAAASRQGFDVQELADKVIGEYVDTFEQLTYGDNNSKHKRARQTPQPVA